MGVTHNLWEFFGPSFPLWLAPLGTPAGDGIRFRTNDAPMHVYEGNVFF
jgi:hypothetical protein